MVNQSIKAVCHGKGVALPREPYQNTKVGDYIGTCAVKCFKLKSEPMRNCHPNFKYIPTWMNYFLN